MTKFDLLPGVQLDTIDLHNTAMSIVRDRLDNGQLSDQQKQGVIDIISDTDNMFAPDFLRCQGVETEGMSKSEMRLRMKEGNKIAKQDLSPVQARKLEILENAYRVIFKHF